MSGEAFPQRRLSVASAPAPGPQRPPVKTFDLPIQSLLFAAIAVILWWLASPPSTHTSYKASPSPYDDPTWGATSDGPLLELEEPHWRMTRDGQFRVFDADELAQFDGSDLRKPILLSLLGRVFDVSNGRRHYGPAGSYSFFAGRDASRAFVTGKFTEDLTDDVASLSHKQIKELHDWLSFYASEYREVGRLVGRFFDADGEPTEMTTTWLPQVLALAQEEAEQEDAERRQLPACNLRWAEGEGGLVWCDKPGHVPREMMSPRLGKRCVCLDLEQAAELAAAGKCAPYRNCSPNASSCKTSS